MITVRSSSRAFRQLLGTTIGAGLSAIVVSIALTKSLEWPVVVGVVLTFLVIATLCTVSLRLRRIRHYNGIIEFRSVFGRTTRIYDNHVLRVVYAPQVTNGVGANQARLMLRDNGGRTIQRLTSDQWNATDLDAFAHSFRYGFELVPGPIGGGELYAMHPDAASYFELHTLRVLLIGLIGMAVVVGVPAWINAQ